MKQMSMRKEANNRMKKLVLKVNMAMIVFVILFASVSFAGLENPTELENYIQRNFERYDVKGVLVQQNQSEDNARKFKSWYQN